MTDGQSIEELLSELISEGTALTPKGGSLVDGYNGRLQPDYVSWRHRSIAAIQELGTRGASILKDLDADNNGPYFFETSAGRVLGALRAARAIVKRPPAQSQTAASAGGQAATTTPGPSSASKVFLVHGHDRALLEQTARFLEKLDLEPVILFEQPGGGRTIVEKLELHGDVNAAVVLLTPDDVGAKAGSPEDVLPRARQNVVLELGYFMGRLGRRNVAVLYGESVELPSDYRGVEYIKVDVEAAWKLKLAQELKHAGLVVDMNKAV